MIGIVMFLLSLSPIQWRSNHTPIKSTTICLGEYQQRLARCAVEYPDAQSLQRSVCDADARGQYTACIGGLP